MPCTALTTQNGTYTVRMVRFAPFLLIALLSLDVPSVTAAGDTAVDPVTGTVRLLLTGEPPSLDSLRATDQLSFFVLAHLMDGLLRYDAANRIAPAIAERWELRDDGATFWLRRDARWEDGTPVTAHDFVYAWRELVRPATAAPYASLLYPVRNAKAIAAGTLDPAELGVRAVDDFRLEVELSEPCAWFPALTAFVTLLPQPRHFRPMQGQRYAADAGRLLANGPFRLESWVHGARLALARNAYYHDAAQVGLERIEVPYMTADERAELNLFLDGRIALANISPDSLRQALHSHLQIDRFPDGYVHFLSFNFRSGRPTRNLHLRRAIQALVDSSEIVERVLRMPGLLPTESLFPSVLRGAERRFIAEHPLVPPLRGPAAARQELAAAMRELGLHEPPRLHLLTGEAASALRIGEFLQARLAEELGIELRLDRQITKQRLQQMMRGDFDLALQNWGPDFDDPESFAQLLESGNAVNRGAYADPRYDELLAATRSAASRAGRLAVFDAIQRLIRDDAALLPLYENVRLYARHPALSGVVRAPFGGDPNLRYARIVPH